MIQSPVFVRVQILQPPGFHCCCCFLFFLVFFSRKLYPYPSHKVFFFLSPTPFGNANLASYFHLKTQLGIKTFNWLQTLHHCKRRLYIIVGLCHGIVCLWISDGHQIPQLRKSQLFLGQASVFAFVPFRYDLLVYADLYNLHVSFGCQMQSQFYSIFQNNLYNFVLKPGGR